MVRVDRLAESFSITFTIGSSIGRTRNKCLVSFDDKTVSLENRIHFVMQLLFVFYM